MDPIPLPQDFRVLLNLLHVRGLKYLLIGGWAVGHYGYVRNTGDIDFWIPIDHTTAVLASDIIKEFMGVTRPAEEFLKVPYILRIGNIPNRVEITTYIEGVDFEECYKRRVESSLEGIPVTLISLDDLLKNKRAAGRDKDLIDIKELEKFRERKKHAEAKAEIKAHTAPAQSPVPDPAPP